MNPPSLPVFEERTFPFWKTLLRYFRDARGLVVLAICFNMVCGPAITAQNSLPKFLTDNILLSDKTGVEKLTAAAWLMAAYVGIALIGLIFFWHMSMRIFARATARALVGIRTLFFKHVHFLCLRFHQQKQSGELLSYGREVCAGNFFSLIARYSYTDKVRFPGDAREYPGGVSFTHDMGTTNHFARSGHSVYEKAGLHECFSHMTHEKLVNWLLCALVYVKQTDDTAWRQRHLPLFDKALQSLLNRDHPDPAQRDGVMSLDSSRYEGI